MSSAWTGPINQKLKLAVLCLTFRSIAQAATDAFMPFYGAIIPGIKSILAAATAPDLALFRGKTMECAGLIAEAVGPTVFAADALEIMQTLMVALVSE